MTDVKELRADGNDPLFDKTNKRRRIIIHSTSFNKVAYLAGILTN